MFSNIMLSTGGRKRETNDMNNSVMKASSGLLSIEEVLDNQEHMVRIKENTNQNLKTL